MPDALARYAALPLRRRLWLRMTGRAGVWIIRESALDVVVMVHAMRLPDNAAGL